MRYFSVKNWAEFQHYKDRSPPWIKLHASVIDDYQFARLQDASKAHLILIWSLASRNGNRLPFDAKWIANRINATVPVDLELLEDQGFIVSDTPRKQQASDLLAPCLSRGEERRDREEEKARSTSVDAPPSVAKENLVTEKADTQAIEIYNAAARACGWPACQKLTPQRRVKLMSRLEDAGGLDGWKTAMERAKASKFLRGDGKRTNGHESWRPSLDFFLQQSSFTKLMEGVYGAELVQETGPPPGVDPVEWYLNNVPKRG